jgi:hypothetical protein
MAVGEVRGKSAVEADRAVPIVVAGERKLALQGEIKVGDPLIMPSK